MTAEKPIVIDLFCGLGGWSEGFLAEGYGCIGFDIERHNYGSGGYPGQLVLQDVLTLHGSQFRDAAVIVASPPCQAYSYRAMPWKRAKTLPPPSNELFNACFRIQREASESADRYIPLVVENVKGAQPWVGRAKWHYGSYYLWGDVPALMPITMRTVKVEGFNFHQYENGWQGRLVSIGRGGGHEGHGKNPVNDRLQQQGTKQEGSGAAWFDNGLCKKSSGSDSRKAASAQIAKIPFPLAQHIARVFRPVQQ